MATDCFVNLYEGIKWSLYLFLFWRVSASELICHSLAYIKSLVWFIIGSSMLLFQHIGKLLDSFKVQTRVHDFIFQIKWLILYKVFLYSLFILMLRCISEAKLDRLYGITSREKSVHLLSSIVVILENIVLFSGNGSFNIDSLGLFVIILGVSDKLQVSKWDFLIFIHCLRESLKITVPTVRHLWLVQNIQSLELVRLM